MATTYTKGLKTASIHILDGNHLDVVDTVDNPSATRAIGKFLNRETIIVDLGTQIAEVPFHAVEYIVVTESKSDSITRADAYCEGGEH